MTNNLPLGFIPIDIAWVGTQRVYLMTKTRDIYTATLAHSEIGDGVIGWRGIPPESINGSILNYYKASSEYDADDKYADSKLINGVVEQMKSDFLFGEIDAIYEMLSLLLEADVENRDIFKRYLPEE